MLLGRRRCIVLVRSIRTSISVNVFVTGARPRGEKGGLREGEGTNEFGF
jgi:hypothetical protein